MSKTEALNRKSTKDFTLSLIAGILIVSNSALLGVVARWFLGIMPTLPGSSTNDPLVFYTLSAIGILFGVLVTLGAILLRSKPANKKVWGLMIIAFSIPSIITGGGFIIGFLLGIMGGKMSLSGNKNESNKAKIRILH
jgi:hypothetical protein